MAALRPNIRGKWRDGIAVPGAVALGFAILTANLPTVGIIRCDKLKLNDLSCLSD